MCSKFGMFEVQFFDVIPPLNIWSAYFSKNIAMLKLVLLKGFQKTQAIACSILELTIPLFSLTNELCYYIWGYSIPIQCSLSLMHILTFFLYGNILDNLYACILHMYLCIHIMYVSNLPAKIQIGLYVS